MKKFKEFINENENIFKSKYGHYSIGMPIISDAIASMNKNNNDNDIIEIDNKNSLNKFISNQRWFSLAESHAFQSIEEYNEWLGDETKSTIWLETGREVVGVWDNANEKGYAVKKNKYLK